MESLLDCKITYILIEAFFATYELGSLEICRCNDTFFPLFDDSWKPINLLFLLVDQLNYHSIALHALMKQWETPTKARYQAQHRSCQYMLFLYRYIFAKYSGYYPQLLVQLFPAGIYEMIYFQIYTYGRKNGAPGFPRGSHPSGNTWATGIPNCRTCCNQQRSAPWKRSNAGCHTSGNRSCWPEATRASGWRGRLSWGSPTRRQPGSSRLPCSTALNGDLES